MTTTHRQIVSPLNGSENGLLHTLSSFNMKSSSLLRAKCWVLPTIKTGQKKKSLSWTFKWNIDWKTEKWYTALSKCNCYARPFPKKLKWLQGWYITETLASLICCQAGEPREGHFRGVDTCEVMLQVVKQEIIINLKKVWLHENVSNSPGGFTGIFELVSLHTRTHLYKIIISALQSFLWLIM